MAEAAMRFTLHDIVHPEMHVMAKQLECSVCLNLVTDPVQTDCGHIFCRECVSPVMVCPACREPVAPGAAKPLHECNKPMMRMIHNLKVVCPNHARTSASVDGEPGAKRRRVQGEGCEWEGSYSDLLAKHIHECPLQVVPCPRGCGERMQRKDLKAHEIVCTKNLVKCPICEELVKPGEMAAHRKESAELHVQLLEAKIQEKDALAGQEAVLSSIQERLTQLEASVKNNAKTQHVTKMIKDRADEVKEALMDGLKKIQAAAQEEFVWEIPDADRLKRQYPKGSRISSPDFCLQGVPFRLVLYPSGGPQSPVGKCGLYLDSDAINHHSQVTLRMDNGPEYLVDQAAGHWAKHFWGNQNLWPVPGGVGDTHKVTIVAKMVFTKKINTVQHTW